MWPRQPPPLPPSVGKKVLKWEVIKPLLSKIIMIIYNSGGRSPWDINVFVYHQVWKWGGSPTKIYKRILILEVVGATIYIRADLIRPKGRGA